MLGRDDLKSPLRQHLRFVTKCCSTRQGVTFLGQEPILGHIGRRKPPLRSVNSQTLTRSIIKQQPCAPHPHHVEHKNRSRLDRNSPPSRLSRPSTGAHALKRALAAGHPAVQHSPASGISRRHAPPIPPRGTPSGAAERKPRAAQRHPGSPCRSTGNESKHHLGTAVTGFRNHEGTSNPHRKPRPRQKTPQYGPGLIRQTACGRPGSHRFHGERAEQPGHEFPT